MVSKISLRKILYSAFKRKLTSEIKVAQFSGYVSEHSAYHHGEASLNGAIVNMAQTYVGSNNINVLEPNGQFGTRLQGGDDSASERYIFTHLNTLTRYIFSELDDPILNYLDDDGTLVEPDYYVPIIPFALINGISGIGTGFSCNIPPFNPVDIVDYLKCKIDKKEKNISFVPYYEGFKGTITKIEEQKFLVKGVYQVVDENTIHITELPVGTWTMPYTSFLESLMDGTDKNGKKTTPQIKDFVSTSTEVNVDFRVTFPKSKLNDLINKNENGINGLEKLLKLTTTISTSNMHMFDKNIRLHKYTSVEEIIDSFYDVRLELYVKRKEHMLNILQHKLLKLSNKARYIQETLNGNIDLRRKNQVLVEELMTKFKFDKIDNDFKYLIKMPMDSVTEENVEQINKERDNAKNEYDTLLNKSVENIWTEELSIFEDKYKIYKKKREEIQSGNSINHKIVKKKIVKK